MLSMAAACRSPRRAISVWPCQKAPSVTPPLVKPAPAARPAARTMAVVGSSQPRTGDQRMPSTLPSPCGSKTATGPFARRRAAVAARLSGRVEVVTTAPGASRMALMTWCRPLPDLGGPTTISESSVDAQHSRPWEWPRRVPTSWGWGFLTAGRAFRPRRRICLRPTACSTSARVARPGRWARDPARPRVLAR